MSVETFNLVAAVILLIIGVFTLCYLALYDRKVAAGEAPRHRWSPSGRGLLLRVGVLFTALGILFMAIHLL